MGHDVSNGSEETAERPLKRARTEEPQETSMTGPGDRLGDTTEGPDSEEEEQPIKPKNNGSGRATDLYLDTVRLFSSSYFYFIPILCQINRAVLDFDFEKVCSVCVSNINVYGCLVCGKYFQGRGPSSYAYAHSIHNDHHVFINLETAMVRSLSPLLKALF